MKVAYFRMLQGVHTDKNPVRSTRQNKYIGRMYIDTLCTIILDGH